MSSKESARQPALIASAVHITNSPSSDFRKNKAVSTDWQERAWRAFDLVGEYRIIAEAIASLVSRADIFIGRLDDNGEIEKIKGNADLDALLDPFTKRHGESSETIRRMALNMYVAGECWWVGVPSGDKNDGGLRLDDSLYGKRRSRGTDLSKFSWHLLSMSEVKHETVDNTVTLTLPHGEVKHSLDAVRLARVWEPHARVHDEADSPTRPALPILEELIGLSMHVSAQVDSRLAGAGILIIPQSAQDGIRASMNLDENDTLADPFTESLIQTMQTAIKDRDSASALVPITVTVPDDWVGKIQHLTFSTPLDEEARELRDEAIRRLALSQDAPPELLLGTGGMNHWGAWMVREDTVNSHVVPRLSSICTALTEQYLWPVAEALGIEDFNDYVIWYDVNDLKARPNRSVDAIELHKAGVLSDEALRREAGFEEKDAPVKKAIDTAAERTLQMVTQAPTLAQHPGIPVVLAVMRHIIDGDPLPEHLDPWKAFVGHNIEDEDSVAPAVPSEDNPVEHVEDDTEPRAGGQPVTQGERAHPEGESL